MNQIYYSDAINILVKKFPEFLDSNYYKETEKSIRYVIYGSFCDYLIDIINNLEEPEENELVQRAFNYFNQMVEEGDREMKNLAFAGIFECLIQSKKVVGVAKELTKGEARKWFDEYPKWFKEPKE